MRAVDFSRAMRSHGCHYRRDRRGVARFVMREPDGAYASFLVSVRAMSDGPGFVPATVAAQMRRAIDRLRATGRAAAF